MFNAYLRGEDHTEFTITLNATTRDAAYDEVADRYPEASVLEIFDPQERAHEIYMRAQKAYDGDYYDYD
jgi:hypothetical protein